MTTTTMNPAKSYKSYKDNIHYSCYTSLNGHAYHNLYNLIDRPSVHDTINSVLHPVGEMVWRVQDMVLDLLHRELYYEVPYNIGSERLDFEIL